MYGFKFAVQDTNAWISHAHHTLLDHTPWPDQSNRASYRPVRGCGANISHQVILDTSRLWLNHRLYRLRNRDWKRITCAHSYCTMHHVPRAVRVTVVNTLKARKVRENRAVRKDWRALIRRRNGQGQVSMGGKYAEGRNGYI